MTRRARARRLIVGGGRRRPGRCGSRSALLYWIDKPLTHDEREYLALARSVAAGRGFVYDDAHDDRHGAAVRPRARLSAVSRARSAPAGRCRDATPRAREDRAGDRRRARRLADRRSSRSAPPGRGPALRRPASRPSIRRSSGFRAYVLSETLYSALALAAALAAAARRRSTRRHGDAAQRRHGCAVASGVLAGARAR